MNKTSQLVEMLTEGPRNLPDLIEDMNMEPTRATLKKAHKYHTIILGVPHFILMARLKGHDIVCHMSGKGEPSTYTITHTKQPS